VVLNQSGDALYFSRAAIPASRSGGLSRDGGTDRKTGRFGKRPSLFFRHQGIYGYRRDLLLRFVRWKTSPLEQAEALEQLRALENGVRIRVVMTGSGSPGVDTPEDARVIERVLKSAGRRSRIRKR
jgi:3-deoxy-manno-octulosonate cytidylyltransferase (CMP-KDO synthetase)